MVKIKKRNGVLVPFDRMRIVNAINKAMIEVDGKLYEEDTANDIADEIRRDVLKSSTIVPVETIQDWVEDYLMRSERRDVAREYIRYRYKRQVARDGGDEFIRAFSEKINGSTIENQNANVDEMSFGGRVGAGSDLQMKKYALDYCVSDMARRNHENNKIYIHDLSAYAVGSHNCLTIPFDELLAKGFNTRQTDVRPAGSVNTAFQLVAVIFQLQSLQQFGGVSAGHLDWTMVPYVRKSFYKHWQDAIIYIGQLFIPDDADDVFQGMPDLSLQDYPTEQYPYRYDRLYSYAIEKTRQEIHQAVEGMYHNLNTLICRAT